ncbi:hypothetical protein TNCV_1684161 [Trichonephila clavipes]|nr:hypothetical protein TNCV_1684161 [Trichonephila clavipes]
MLAIFKVCWEGLDAHGIEAAPSQNLVKLSEVNCHSISASKSSRVHFCRKRDLHLNPDGIHNTRIPVLSDA